MSLLSALSRRFFEMNQQRRILAQPVSILEDRAKIRVDPLALKLNGSSKPKRKTTQLKYMLQNTSELSFLMEAHNGLSAKIVENTGFRGIWGSGLSMSAAMGVRDNNEASWTQVLDNLEFMADITKIPILLDGDTGYGNFNNARRLVSKLEQRGVAGVCIEDKLFPKTNSFLNGDTQELADINEFCGKLEAMKDTQVDEDFQVVARLESFICGRGLYDALERAYAYADAGADAILCHSKRADESDIARFMANWDGRKPIVIVPTKYYSTPTDRFRDLGISSIIWANHNVRSAINAMETTCEAIYQEQSLMPVEKKVATVSHIFELQSNTELQDAEKKYLNYKRVEQRVDPAAETKLVPSDVTALMKQHGLTKYFGVPDSLLKELLSCIDDDEELKNVMTCNEGTAVSTAIGQYISTGEIPVVYLQNSGFGHIINPLLSVCRVYNVPILFVMGCRAYPGTKDEPQHLYQGKYSESLLRAADTKYSILPTHSLTETHRILTQAVSYMKEYNRPYFLCVKPNSFEKHERTKTAAAATTSDFTMKRYDALQAITSFFSAEQSMKTGFVSTTGYTSRELYDIRVKDYAGETSTDFYMIGGMGHACSVGMGIATSVSQKMRTVVLDGDGSFMMHLGGVVNLGTKLPANFVYVMINNQSHESVGGQKIEHRVQFGELMKSVGLEDDRVLIVDNLEELNGALSQTVQLDGPVFIQVNVASGTLQTLARPQLDWPKQKEAFMEYIQGC